MATEQHAAQFTHSREFARILAHLESSLLVATYQAGQVCAIGTAPAASVTNGDGPAELSIQVEPFALAMGIAPHPRRIAVGTRGIVWFLEPSRRELAHRIPPQGRYDAVLVSANCHVTAIL